jgi:hypothetical protein
MVVQRQRWNTEAETAPNRRNETRRNAYQTNAFSLLQSILVGEFKFLYINSRTTEQTRTQLDSLSAKRSLLQGPQPTDACHRHRVIRQSAIRSVTLAALRRVGSRRWSRRASICASLQSFSSEPPISLIQKQSK